MSLMRLFSSSSSGRSGDPRRTRKLDHATVKKYKESMQEAFKEWWEYVDEDEAPKPESNYLFFRVFSKKNGKVIKKWSRLFFFNGDLVEKLMDENGNYTGMRRAILPNTEEYSKIKKAILWGRVECYYSDNIDPEIVLGRRLTDHEAELIRNNRK